MPSNVSMKELLETGVHFGHRTTKWNPKMKPFIYTERNGIHIIDLQQTIENLNTYYDLIRDTVANNGVVLFVGTKRQAQEAIARAAEDAGMPYINVRWLGGTLTNWTTIRKSLDQLKNLEKRRERGDFERLTKKEQLTLSRKIDKLNERLGGIRDMKRLPDLIVVIDTRRESTAVKEANTLKIPVLAIADTNSDPNQIDYIIPGNDDAVRAIKLLVGALTDAAKEGSMLRKGIDKDAAPGDGGGMMSGYVSDKDGADDDALLGESTLAKIRSTSLDALDAE
jgi:small subunit ribosomal protein S2